MKINENNRTPLNIYRKTMKINRIPMKLYRISLKVDTTSIENQYSYIHQQ